MLEGNWVGVQHILSKGLPQDPLCVRVNGLVCHFRPSLGRALTLHACGTIRLVLKANSDQLPLVARHIHMCLQASNSNESHLPLSPDCNFYWYENNLHGCGIKASLRALFGWTWYNMKGKDLCVAVQKCWHKCRFTLDQAAPTNACQSCHAVLFSHDLPKIEYNKQVNTVILLS